MNRRQYLATWLFTCLLVSSLCLVQPADAHRLRPAIVTVTFGDDGTWEAALQLNLEAVLAGIGPEHEDTSQAPQAGVYNALRELPPAALRARFEAAAPRLIEGIDLRFDGRRVTAGVVAVDIPPVGDLGVERLTTIRFAGDIPPGSAAFTWRYAAEYGESALRLAMPGGEVVRADWLMAGQASAPFQLDPALVPVRTTGDVFRDYTVLGFTHILPKGLDHILFVLGIFLLSVHWRPLLYQVTAFTVAHSITLALSLYGVISLPASVVEPLIALSIVYVAVENIVVGELRPWRVWVVFGFGLLHGLGFAGVLTELGLPAGEFLPALIAFNVGVELGQLAVISLAFLAVGLWFRARPWYRARIVIPASLLIAMVGAYWTVERILG
ncbi:MAG: HupE/UreJ family protein [Chromatiales bacterium]|nr:HupE/UreJ family protein [Chromatiales bacterium]